MHFYQVEKLSTVYEYVVRDDREVVKSFLAPSSSYCCSFTPCSALLYIIYGHLIDDPVNNGYDHKSHLVCIYVVQYYVCVGTT